MGVPWWVWPQSVVWVLVHLYLWRRLAAATLRRGRARRVGTVVIVVLAPSVPGALIALHTLSASGGRWATWPGFVWYGLVVYLLIVLVAVDAVRGAVALVRRVRRRRVPVSEPSESRRRFVARGVALGASAVAVGTVGYGTATAFSTPRLERVAVRLPQLPAAAVGFRIALISDTHIGPFVGRDEMRRIVARINATRPDLALIAGDLADGTVAELGYAAEPLGELRARHGTYFTTGNHEYLFEADAWVEHLRTLGIRTLRNERIALPHFDLAGVNDVTGADNDDPPDYRRALGERDARRPVVLVAHQPVQAYEAEKYGVDLQLAGHTHGGQFYPGNAVNALAQPLVSGLGAVGRTQLYVTRGTGFWGPPIRVGAPPEITLIQPNR
jgi:uncharacterized protein